MSLSMTLDEAWDNALAMWKDIAEMPLHLRPRVSVAKVRWLVQHGYTDPDADVEATCFFCEYDSANSDGGDCEMCPARLVDEDFCCENPEYSWHDKPDEFYRKLCALNQKRLKLL